MPSEKSLSLNSESLTIVLNTKSGHASLRQDELMHNLNGVLVKISIDSLGELILNDF